jgi:hypothetical protein
MEFKNLILTMAIALAVPAFIVGCDKNDGPMEKAGKEIDNAVEKTGEAIEDTGDKVKESVN